MRTCEAPLRTVILKDFPLKLTTSIVCRRFSCLTSFVDLTWTAGVDVSGRPRTIEMGNRNSQTEAGYAAPSSQLFGENGRSVQTDEASAKTAKETSSGQEERTEPGDKVAALQRRSTVRSLPSRTYVEHHVKMECEGLLEKGDVDPAEGWEAIFQDGEKLRVWRRKVHPRSTAFEYALRGKTEHPPHIFFRTAFLDVDHRKRWDESCGDAKFLERCETSGVETLYWVTKYPWPVAERDYVYHRIVSKSQSSFHSVSWVGNPPTTLALQDYTPPSERILTQVPNHRVRVQDYRTAMLVRETPEGGALWCLRVLDDPKVAIIPTSVVNWIVSKTLPSSANKLEKACEAFGKAGK